VFLLKFHGFVWIDILTLLATVREELSPASGSCSFGSLRDFLVVGFFGGIIPVTENTLQVGVQGDIG